MFLSLFRLSVTVVTRPTLQIQQIQSTNNPTFQRSVRNVIQQVQTGNLPDLTFMMQVISQSIQENIKENGKAALIVICNLIIIPFSVVLIVMNTTNQKWTVNTGESTAILTIVLPVMVAIQQDGKKVRLITM